ncbi:MAG: VCBS repeat-containing protein [Planctomycetes bacterium]|nr:VCBS repeat-containing protein [Planctomycetota bacterium]
MNAVPQLQLHGPRLVAASLGLAVLAACGGSGSSSGSSQPGPRVVGYALIADVNANGALDAGDTVTVCFDRAVDARAASVEDFELPVEGDSFGAGATVAPDARAERVVITLGTRPRLRARGTHDVGRAMPNAPSGLTTAVDASGIVDASTGTPARPAAAPVDVAPGFTAAPAGRGPSRGGGVVETGDLDGDGDHDLVIGGDRGDDAVWINDGSGSFTELAGAFAGGTGSTTALLLADLDGDGDLDIWSGRNGSDQVWINDGSARFTAGASMPASRTTALGVGDVDRDGDLDVLQGNGAGQLDRIWLNDGAGVFTAGATLGGRDNTHTVLLVDVDGDAILDAVQGRSGPNALFFGDGAGNFADSGQTIGTGSTRSIAAGDLDCDGDVDLIVAGRDPSRAWLNDGHGVFAPTDRLVNAATDRVILADIDEDGDLDVFAGNGNRQPDEIWFLDPAGNLTDSGQRLGDRATLGVAAADLDGDGDVDFVAAVDGAAPYVWLNSMAGTLGPVTYTPDGAVFGGNAVFGFAALDLDLDGDADLVATRGAGVDVGLADNDGRGAFAERDLPGSAGADVVAVADFDRDGIDDLLLGGAASAPALWLGDGAGMFTMQPRTLSLAGIEAALVADVDVDARPDIVVVHASTTREVQVWLQDAVTGAYPAVSQQLGARVRSIALADVDADGHDDLVLGTDAGVEIALHDGVSAFLASAATLGNDRIDAIATGDLDGDGVADLQLGGPNGFAVWLNDGGGAFPAAPALAGSATSALLAVDLDRDGDVDAIRGDATGADEFLVNDGTGQLTADPNVALWNGPTAHIALIDADRDCNRDLDMFVSTGDAARPGVQRLRRD